MTGSPYLDRPLRELEQALREIEESKQRLVRKRPPATKAERPYLRLIYSRDHPAA